MRPQKASAVPLLACLLFPIVIAASARDFLGQEACSPSSCGPLGSIRYPFRLKTDPAGFGDARYEFACVDNKTVLEYQSSKYYVTDILYGSSLIQVVDAGFATGSCGLPTGTLPPGPTQLLGNYYGFRTNGWASFVKCSREIKRDAYREVPCGTRNGTFVYVVSGYQVARLAPSCGFLSMTPVLDADAEINSRTDVFRLLSKGFLLYWSVGELTTSDIVRNCKDDSVGMFKDLIRSNNFLSKISSLVKSQMHFLACLEDYSGVSKQIDHIFHLAIAIMVLVEIVQLVIVLAILGRFLAAPMVIFAFLCGVLRSTLASIDVVEKFLRDQQTLSPTRYAYTDIIAMTNNFKVKLGQGGFGSVFKGTLPTGGRLVAVKMLGNSRCNGEEFISEVSTIGRIRHHNVVRLIGYCSDGSNRALVYEYMPNGSLDKYIFSSNPTYRPFSSLEKLNEIALGVARGIDYLHRGCEMTILHFDIKPHNILLDRDFSPKVSDFGLAKLYPKDYSMVCLSVARGTTGYIAPELISRNFGVVSYKSDVYSYGMRLMEMAGGRRNVDTRAGGSSRAYYHWWIYDRLRQDHGESKIDEGFEIGEVERKLCIVGLWCIQIKPSDRPSMGRVIEMLEADVGDLPMPPKPFLSSPEPPSMELEASVNSSLT